MNPGSESSENPVGDIIRGQRELAELSMGQGRGNACLYNPYLSQIEHRLRASSEAVLEPTAATLGRSPETLRPGTNDDHGPEEDHDHDHDQERPTEHTSLVAAISTDPGLPARQRRISPKSPPQ